MKLNVSNNPVLLTECLCFHLKTRLCFSLNWKNQVKKTMDVCRFPKSSSWAGKMLLVEYLVKQLKSVFLFYWCSSHWQPASQWEQTVLSCSSSGDRKSALCQSEPHVSTLKKQPRIDFKLLCKHTKQNLWWSHQVGDRSETRCRCFLIHRVH